MKETKSRCAWAKKEIEIRYHDEEWGRPLHDDLRLFEMLILEMMQTGLSWLTILNKRENFRAAFDGFNAEKMAAYDEEKVNALMQDAGIIRNRSKITAAIGNAQHFLDIQAEFGSFDRYIWSFVDGEPIRNHFESLDDVPAQSVEAVKMSKDMKKRGFRFVGPVVAYAYMQSIGMVNDHLIHCPAR